MHRITSASFALTSRMSSATLTSYALEAYLRARYASVWCLFLACNPKRWRFSASNVPLGRAAVLLMTVFILGFQFVAGLNLCKLRLTKEETECIEDFYECPKHKEKMYLRFKTRVKVAQHFVFFLDCLDTSFFSQAIKQVHPRCRVCFCRQRAPH
jgi:hypothetical protein